MYKKYSSLSSSDLNIYKITIDYLASRMSQSKQKQLHPQWTRLKLLFIHSHETI